MERQREREGGVVRGRRKRERGGGRETDKDRKTGRNLETERRGRETGGG